MTSFCFTPPPVVNLGLDHAEHESFPVGRVFCVGRNYAAHAREMGVTPAQNPADKAPIFFTKPSTALVSCPTHETTDIAYPTQTHDLHHEAELVCLIGPPKTGSIPPQGYRNLALDQAKNIIFGFACGVDLTRRDLQAQAKKAGQPWDMAKAFDYSAPIGPITKLKDSGFLIQGGISLTVNGEMRQDGQLQDMIWSLDWIIYHLSRFVALFPGDVIFTGTPDGVGPLQIDDRVEVHIASLVPLSFKITPPLQ